MKPNINVGWQREVISWFFLIHRRPYWLLQYITRDFWICGCVLRNRVSVYMQISCIELFFLSRPWCTRPRSEASEFWCRYIADFNSRLVNSAVSKYTLPLNIMLMKLYPIIFKVQLAKIVSEKFRSFTNSCFHKQESL